MDIYQSILMAEYIERERAERVQHAADRWHLTAHGAQKPTLRETLAVALIALAHRLAPQHTTLSVQ